MGLTPGASGLDAVAERLYAGDPARFVADRTAAAKAARAAGDTALATAIGALRRPTLSAWYVNLAARASLVSLREWLTLGEELRAAQEAGDAARVRTLSAGRTRLESRVVADLVAHLGAVAVAASPAALEEVRATLRAALSDPAAAAAVASGRLARPLSYGGFGEVDLSAALAAMATAVPEEPPPEEPPAPDPELLAARDTAREALAQAEASARDADADVAEAERHLRLATTRRDRARGALERASAALASAEEALRDG